jgi:hypothetical protein
MRIQIPGSTLNRDMGSRGLIETDRAKAEEYKVKAKMLNDARCTQDEINTIKQKISEIDNIKTDLNEIKELLKGLVK